ncbi:MAG: hypothetical protein ABSF61_12730 [Anaerolineales bacterium]
MSEEEGQVQGLGDLLVVGVLAAVVGHQTSQGSLRQLVDRDVGGLFRRARGGFGEQGERLRRSTKALTVCSGG